MAQFLETAANIAREAGAKASERLVVDRLKSAFPTHSIIGEEGGGQITGSDYCWYVDPLDGTTNFAHGFPVYNVSIGLEKAGELIAGAVYDPTRDELFSAERGSGTYLNGERIRVSNVKRLEESLVATGFPSRRRHQNVNVHFYYQLAMLTHGVRRAGAAAIDLCYVACGRLDAFWEFGLNPWDLEEAGGKATDMKDNPATVRAPHLLTSNGFLHRETVELFARIFAGDYPFPIVEMPASGT
jgi:myo-inositol-1(or 4)-monophosphatase